MFLSKVNQLRLEILVVTILTSLSPLLFGNQINAAGASVQGGGRWLDNIVNQYCGPYSIQGIFIDSESDRVSLLVGSDFGFTLTIANTQTDTVTYNIQGHWDHDDICPQPNIPPGGVDFQVSGKCGRSPIQFKSSVFNGVWPGLVECKTTSTPPTSNGNCVTGSDKNDNLIGTSGNDCIDGKGGNDKIAGLAGNDKLNSGDGKDLLSGGAGNDELTGGSGADKFDCGAGNDKITDFNPSEGDIKSTNCEQF
jgi:Ca2+-binding RTX toxin-like protein